MTRRLREAGVKRDERQRLARWEMSHAQYYDYVVTNEDAQAAANDVMEIIRMERRRRHGVDSNG